MACWAAAPGPAFAVFRPAPRPAVLCRAAQQPDSIAGKCWIVSAGPGPADLLTVRAAEVLRQADVVIYDDLGAQAAVEAYAPPVAERLYVGKRGGQPSIKQPAIDALLVQQAAAGAAAGRTVVRLKGGCASVFARLHSEVAALRAAGLDYEIVPGVSSALAAPLAAGFPLTHPQLSRAFAVTSAHDLDAMDWPALAALDTLVLLMGGSNLARIAEELQRHGKPPGTPVAVVHQAQLPGQRTWRGDLAGIAAQCEGQQLSPCIVVVGAVAGGV